MAFVFTITVGSLKFGFEHGCLFVETEWVDVWIGRRCGYSTHKA